MQQYLYYSPRIYFEAMCVVELGSLASLGSHSAVKLSKFCKESSLSMYVVRFMDGGHSDVLFLTKQRLIPSTGYYCSNSNLGIRTFAGVEVLVANTVKRIMPKSDSKFIDKFVQLLTPGGIYLRKLSHSAILMFSRQSNDTLKFWHEFTEESPKMPKNRGCSKMSKNGNLPDNRSMVSQILLTQMNLEETYLAAQGVLGKAPLTICQINPPNILCGLWREPKLIREYFQRKALEGNREEGECPKAEFLAQKTSGPKESFRISGIGTIFLIQQFQEETTKRSPSKANTCETTAEQRRGFAKSLEVEDDELSSSFDEPTPKAIAQTMALLSSGKHNYSITDSVNHLAIYAMLKKKIKPGRDFALF